MDMIHASVLRISHVDVSVDSESFPLSTYAVHPRQGERLKGMMDARSLIRCIRRNSWTNKHRKNPILRALASGDVPLRLSSSVKLLSNIAAPAVIGAVLTSN